MDRKEYEGFVFSLMHKDGKPMPIELACLGLVGELGELIEAKEGDVIKELGDLLWYTTAIELLTMRQAPILSDPPPSGEIGLMVSVATICEIVKKSAWHGKDLDVSKLLEHTELVQHALACASSCYLTTIEEVRAKNVEKLRARYPKKFVEGGGIR